MYEIGNIIDNNIELSSQDYEIIPLNILLHGTEALIIYFIPFTFGVPSENSFDSLLMEINKNIQKFNQNDIRTIFVTRYISFLRMIYYLILYYIIFLFQRAPKH